MVYKLAHMTDIHISDRAFGNRQDTYVEEIKAKLMQVRDICNQEHRDLYFTGDLFEYPSPRQVSHALTQWLITYFNGYYNDIYLIAGNHDLTSEGIASLWKQPLGVLIQSGVVEWVKDGRVLRPKTSDVVLIQGKNYHEDGEHDPKFFEVEWPEGRTVNILMAHGMLCPPHYNYPYDSVKYDQVNWGKTNLVLYGHPHDDHSWTVRERTTIVSCGSLSRRSRVQKRDVFLATIDIDEKTRRISVDKRKLNAAPWQNIFREIEVVDESHIDDEMISLAGDIRNQMSADEVNFEALLEAMKSEMKEETYNCVKRYLGQATEKNFSEDATDGKA